MRKQTKLWSTKSGEKIRICDMGDKHLLNTIKLLDNFAKHKEHQARKAGYSALRFLSGEQAILDIENELEHLEEGGIDPNEICPLYDNLIEEALRRNII
ncbi:hypothetical protein LCGC14_2152690 [marine sediment metagenome]|uniref:Uncharacterized protein n=1 Tax=marine sediment metagenome TaxID=412755 RepID=A0A0F9GRF7_9ZZZZ